MINEKSRQWINALLQIETYPQAKVRCPECDTGFLFIKDVPVPQWNKMDRYLICDACGKYNVATNVLP
jgi:hypothetical protein